MAYRQALALVAALLLSAAAAAQEKPPAASDHAQRLMQRMDRDGDGKVSFEEYRNAMLRRFDSRDKNKNGVLEGSEIPRSWLADNGSADSRVDLEEYGAQLESSFAQFDTNKDGQLDLDEVRALSAARKAQQESQP
jgi:Ca2+-binding EF-hand superfamily protein